jgi:hypothetical protein
MTHNYLFFVDEFRKKYTLVAVKTKQVGDLVEATRQVIGEYLSRGFTVKLIRVDHESTLKAMRPHLLLGGVDVSSYAPGVKNKVAERGSASIK